MARHSLLVALVFASPASAQTELFHFTDSSKMFGRPVVSLSDIDQDGVRDFAIGYGKLSSKGVLLVSGKDGSVINGQSGWPMDEIVAVGDVDGDGVDDLGLARQNANEFRVVRLPSLETFIVVSEIEFYFGVTLAGVGDVDKDGYGDVLAGAPRATVGYHECGWVRLYSGKTMAMLEQWSGFGPNAHFGAAVAAAGDVDADGWPDFLISEPDTANPSVYVYSGKNSAQMAKVVSSQTYDRFGSSIAGGFDLNQDGHPDFVVGAPFADSPPNYDSGRVDVVSGASFTNLATYFGTQMNGRFGEAVAPAGDVDHDGVMDIMVGAPDHVTAFGVGKGAVRVFSGATGAQIRAWFGSSTSAGFGRHVAGLGDLNGDGFAEVAFSEATGAWVHSGKAYDSTWDLYGTGVAGSNGLPEIAPSGDPTICAAWQLDLRSAAPATSPALILVGAVAVDLPSAYGGSILAAPNATVALVLPNGTTSIQVAPCNVMLTGVEAYLQLLHQDAGAPAGIAFSRGLHLVLGL